MINTLIEVVNNGLCCNCGTCEGICPKNAIELRVNKQKREYRPFVDETKCNNCNKCLLICPGYFVNYKKLNQTFFCKEPEDILLGNYSNCYIGNASDEDIRFNSSSGGMVTQILIYALDKGIIDGALVTRMNRDHPLEPEPFIAKTPEEIIEASKSKYCPVPVNKVLKELLNTTEIKLAVVGLPCHIHGVRNAEIIMGALKEKIVLHIGIFCSHTDTFWQTESLLNKLGIEPSEISEINYRGDGWPGKMSVKLKNDEIITIPYFKSISQHNLWINALFRCMFCCDLTAELSDMSFGDPWLHEIEKYEKKGKSIVVCRTQNGEKILSNAVADGYIHLNELSPECVKKSGSMMESKKRDIKARIFIRKIFRKEIPNYQTVLQKPNFKNYLRALFVYFNVVLSSKRSLQKFLVKLSDLETKLFQMGGN